MVKIDTLFQTKTAKKTIPFGVAHTFIANNKGVREGGGGGGGVLGGMNLYFVFANIIHLTYHIAFDSSLSFYSVFFL